MSTKTIEEFFTGKTLVVPSYQRDYNELIASRQTIETTATDAGPRGTQVSLDIQLGRV